MDEGRHRPTDDRWWGESWTFELATPDGRLGAFVRLQLLPNQGTCWYWAWVVGPDRAPVAVIDHEVPLPRGPSLELRTGGLWADHVVEEPGEHVSVGAEAFALRLDDPAEALGPLVGLPTPFGLDLGWETDGAGRSAGDDGPEGYSLPCRVVGEVLGADERLGVDAVGYRHHAWGVEDWWSAGWTAVHGRLDDGTWFTTRAAGTASTAARDTLPTADRVRVRVGGADLEMDLEMDLAVEPLAYAPVALTDHDGRRSHLVRALCHFRERSRGRAGVGWAEWNQPL